MRCYLVAAAADDDSLFFVYFFFFFKYVMHDVCFVSMCMFMCVFVCIMFIMFLRSMRVNQLYYVQFSYEKLLNGDICLFVFFFI